MKWAEPTTGGIRIAQRNLSRQGRHEHDRGIVEEWCIADGERVEKGDLLYRLETEKVNLDVDAEATGIVRHIVAEGVTMKPGDVVGYIYEPGEAIPDVLPKAGANAAAAEAAPVQAASQRLRQPCRWRKTAGCSPPPQPGAWPAN